MRYHPVSKHFQISFSEVESNMYLNLYESIDGTTTNARLLRRLDYSVDATTDPSNPTYNFTHVIQQNVPCEKKYFYKIFDKYGNEGSCSTIQTVDFDTTQYSPDIQIQEIDEHSKTINFILPELEDFESIKIYISDSDNPSEQIFVETITSYSQIDDLIYSYNFDTLLDGTYTLHFYPAYTSFANPSSEIVGTTPYSYHFEVASETFTYTFSGTISDVVLTKARDGNVNIKCTYTEADADKIKFYWYDTTNPSDIYEKEMQCVKYNSYTTATNFEDSKTIKVYFELIKTIGESEFTKEFTDDEWTCITDAVGPTQTEGTWTIN